MQSQQLAPKKQKKRQLTPQQQQLYALELQIQKLSEDYKCSECKLPQQILRTQILLSQVCNIPMCIFCFNKLKNQKCKTCVRLIIQHFPHIKQKKIRTARNPTDPKKPKDQKIYQQIARATNKQRNTRIDPTYQKFDSQTINMLVYLKSQFNPQKFNNIQKPFKNVIQQQKKQARAAQGNINRKAILIGKQHNRNLTGKQACGYNEGYQKGLNLIFSTYGIKKNKNIIQT